MISRRKFIGAAGGVAGAAALGGGAWAALVRDSVEESTDPASTSSTAMPSSITSGGDADPRGTSARVLVVLEMAGGNDALNTLVPVDGRYRDVRPTLALADDELVELAGTDVRLHPALAPLVSHWDAGTMAAAAGVGMTAQSRSHFKAMETWWSAVPGGTARTGWLGRWLDATLDGDPDPLRAIGLGGGARALASTSSLSTVVHSPQAFQLRTFPGVDREALIDAFIATASPLAPVPELAAAQAAIPSTVEAIELLAQVSGGDTEGADYGTRVRPDGNSAAQLLDTAAGIIDLGVGARVITVGIGGFDTHAEQAGTHLELLTDVGEGIAAFLERIEADGHADEVMLVTTTEFGRRVEENGSLGTDHGDGGLQFVFGPRVQGGRVIGEFDLDNLVDGDLPSVVDTRSVYSVALDWLGGPTDELLDGPHDRLGLVA